MLRLDDSDVGRILRNMEKQFTKVEMIKSVKNPKLKHLLFDKYMYGLYSRQPITTKVHRDNQAVFTRNIGQTRNHVSYKQYIELNAGLKDKYLEEYERLEREKREKDRNAKSKR